jgi:hypothetical protein
MELNHQTKALQAFPSTFGFRAANALMRPMYIALNPQS